MLALALGVVAAGASPGCSLQSLDYLDSGARPVGGGAGLTSVGGAAGGASAGTAGVSGASGAGATAGASSGAPDGGAAGSGGGSAAAGESGSTAAAGAADGGGIGGAGGVGGADAGADSGAGGSSKVMVYGIDGQSCGDGLLCPGGASCCRRLEVPGGTFSMGANGDPDALADEKPQHTANVALFELDELEVTVGRFRRFFDVYDGTLPKTGGGASPKVSGSGWQPGFSAQMPSSQAELKQQLDCDVGGYQTWTDSEGVRESMPVNCVSWYVAFAFCVWDGGRLPSEAEWEMAAAGGMDHRLYPWGASAPDPATNVVANCSADGSAGCSPNDLLPVNSRPAGAGKWGHQDLAGSLWEWTLDYYDATYYQAVGTCNDCADLNGLTPRVIRGGNFTSLTKNLRTTGRASKPPINIDPYAGFRCARSP